MCLCWCNGFKCGRDPAVVNGKDAIALPYDINKVWGIIVFGLSITAIVHISIRPYLLIPLSIPAIVVVLFCFTQLGTLHIAVENGIFFISKSGCCRLIYQRDTIYPLNEISHFATNRHHAKDEMYLRVMPKKHTSTYNKIVMKGIHNQAGVNPKSREIEQWWKSNTITAQYPADFEWNVHHDRCRPLDIILAELQPEKDEMALEIAETEADVRWDNHVASATTNGASTTTNVVSVTTNVASTTTNVNNSDIVVVPNDFDSFLLKVKLQDRRNGKIIDMAHEIDPEKMVNEYNMLKESQLTEQNGDEQIIQLLVDKADTILKIKNIEVHLDGNVGEGEVGEPDELPQYESL